LAAAALVLVASFASAQDPARIQTSQAPGAQAGSTSPVAGAVTAQDTVITRASSVERPEDAGVRAQTHYVIFVPAGGGVSSGAPKKFTHLCFRVVELDGTVKSIDENINSAYERWKNESKIKHISADDRRAGVGRE